MNHGRALGLYNTNTRPHSPRLGAIKKKHVAMVIMGNDVRSNLFWCNIFEMFINE